MISHGWTILCTRSITDPQSNNVSLIDVVEQVNLQQTNPPVAFPALLPLQMDLVTMWYRSNPEERINGTGRFSFMRGTTEIVPPTEFAINLSAHERLRTVGRIAGLPIHGPGLYFFKVELRSEDGTWREISKLPLNVVVNP